MIPTRNANHRKPSRALLLALGLPLLLSSCSTTKIDLDAWRARQTWTDVTAADASVETALVAIDAARSSGELAQARQTALALAAAHPGDGRALLAASRAESDAVHLFDEEDRDSRNHALASALDYAERALEAGLRGADAHAQHAWALGSTTHLLPMGERSARARATREAAERALAIDAEEPTALATLAMIELRLETLPWIARWMASDLPASSLTAAEAFARRAAAVRPSREHRHVLAKVLIAAGREGEARELLLQALAEPAHFPRDAELAPALERTLAEL